MSDVAQRQPNAKEIFLRASELLNEEDRHAYLAEACGGDSVLQHNIEAMVRANLKAGSNPLDALEAAFGPESTANTATVLEARSDAFSQRQIGPYKLLEQIGEGGFGTVYMADQTTPFRRKVAVKVLNPGMDSREVLARFEAERQALAMMDHPNIARVLDAGTTGEGRPYFAMELVHGIPVTQYCDEARLTTDERLTLFIDMCRAVQHAHLKGIIHRDLKPSNVLVTMHDDTAVPKVIDFGIAKALSQQLTERTLFTGYHQLLGTPMYMSPEQAQMSGIDVDTRSDVYSLGVLLYELLTGTTPFTKESLLSASFDELRRIIREQEPPRPSARLTTLDAQARSTLADRRKIDQRRISDLLRGELDWIVMKALEKDRNRRYESASALAADVDRYLNDEPVQACPPSAWYRMQKFGRRHQARLLVCSALFAALFLVAGTLLNVRFQSHAREEAATQAIAAAIASAETAIDANNLNMGEQKLAEARPFLELAGPTAAAFRIQLQALQKELDEIRADAAVFDRFVTLVRDAQDRMFNGRDGDSPIQAALDARAALDLFEISGQSDWTKRLEQRRLSEAQKRQVRQTIYETLLLLADDSVRWTDRASSETARRALEDLDLARRHHDPTKAFYWASMQIHGFLKDTAAAETDRRQYDATPARTAWDCFLPGHSAGWAGDLKTAIRSYEAALRIEPDHFSSLYFLAMRLGTRKENRYAEALGYWSACVALRPQHSGARESRANTYWNLGHLEAAEEEYRAAIAIDPGRASLYVYFSSLLLQLQEAGEALVCARKAIAIDPQIERAHHNLSVALMALDQLDEAVISARRSIEIGRQSGGETDLSGSLTLLTLVLLKQQQFQEAESRAREAVAIRERLLPDHWTLFNAKSLLGESLAGQYRFDEAEPILREGFDGLLKHESTITTELAPLLRTERITDAVNRLIRLYEAWDKPEEAAKWKGELVALQARWQKEAETPITQLDASKQDSGNSPLPESPDSN